MSLDYLSCVEPAVVIALAQHPNRFKISCFAFLLRDRVTSQGLGLRYDDLQGWKLSSLI